MINRLFGYRIPRLSYTFPELPTTELSVPDTLYFALGNGEPCWRVAVEPGEEIQVGQSFAHRGDLGAYMSPVDGTVTEVSYRLNMRGFTNVPTVVVKPTGAARPNPLPPLAGHESFVDKLWARLDEAGIWAGTAEPLALSAHLERGPTAGFSHLVVLAVDAEPALGAARAALRERPEDAVRAAALLSRMCGGIPTTLVVAAPDEALVKATAEQQKVSLATVKGRYPAGVPAQLARKQGFKAPKFVPVGVALEALDAIERGHIPSHRIITLLQPDGTPLKNLRVPLGTPLSALIAEAGWTVNEGDKVVAGGLFSGTAQARLDVGIDPLVAACTVIPASSVRRWTNEPCINCGNCVRACPTNLQPQLLGRLAEYSLFERTRAEAIDLCIECGLCGSVCPAHRPLLQWIRLARTELQRQDEEAEAPETPETPVDDTWKEEKAHG